MQVMPRTGRELARHMGLPWSTARLVEPEFNLRLGTTYLRQVLEMFDGNLDLALAGYNGGPFRVKRLWAQAGADRELDRFLEGLAIEESKTYVKRILVLSDSYRQLYPQGRRDGEAICDLRPGSRRRLIYCPFAPATRRGAGGRGARPLRVHSSAVRASGS